MDNVTNIPTGNVRDLILSRKYLDIIDSAMSEGDYDTAAKSAERLMTMLSNVQQEPSGAIRRAKRAEDGVTRASIFIESYAELTDGQGLSLTENISELIVDLLHMQEHYNDVETAFQTLDDARIAFIVS